MDSKSWIDDIDFGLMYRVKGHSGLYNKRGEANKSGVVPVVSVGDTSFTSVVSAQCLISLGDLEFTTYAGHDDLLIVDVFKNLSGYFESHNEIPDAKEIMNVMVPEYDEDLFRPSHARMVLSWYVEWINKVNKISNENENE